MKADNNQTTINKRVVAIVFATLLLFLLEVSTMNSQTRPQDKPIGKPPAPNSRSNPAKNKERKPEDIYWESIRNSKDPADFRAYLRKYPSGEYKDLAQNALKRLEKPSTPKPNTPGIDPTLPNNVKWEFVRIPAGNFTMRSSNGESNREPGHKVIISRSFEIGKYEVTQEQWEAVMGNNPSHFKGDGRLPVEQVSWDDVQEFIKKVNESSKQYIYRLPTEAEWEYAARAGSWGDYTANLDAMGWYGNNSGDRPIDAEAIYKINKDDYVKKVLANNCRTHIVGGKQANAWGLYDMHGNVREWCADWYGDYSSETVTDPQGASSGLYRVNRGGSWGNLASSCRLTLRNNNLPSNRSVYLGFRLLRSS